MAGQAWTPAADGGYFANPKLSKKLRHATQPLLKFRQMVRPVDSFGKGQGDTVDYDKVSNVATAGGKIGEQQKMPETKYTIRRGQIIVDEWGNSVPYTGKLELLSEFNIANPTQKAIRDDMAKTIDAGIATEAKLTPITYTPTSAAAGTWNTAGSPAASGVNMNLFHLKEVVDYAIEANMPPATGGPDGDYVLIATQKLIRSLLDDPEFIDVAKYARAEKVLQGEIGRVYRTRILLTTHTSALTKKNSSTMGEGMFFGDDAMVEAIALPEELRAKTPDDYGRSKGIAWYMLGNFKLTYDYTTDGEFRAIYITTSTA